MDKTVIMLIIRCAGGDSNVYTNKVHDPVTANANGRDLGSRTPSVSNALYFNGLGELFDAGACVLGQSRIATPSVLSYGAKSAGAGAGTCA